jgi:hypothetical protein
VNSGTAGKITVQAPSLLNAGRITANANDGRAGEIEFTSQNHTFMAITRRPPISSRPQARGVGPQARPVGGGSNCSRSTFSGGGGF